MLFRSLLGLVSSFTKADGSQHQMADVWVAKDTPPPSLGDLLAAPSADLLASAAVAAAAAPADAHASGASVQHAFIDRRQADDELNRHTPLI